ncbi:MAG: hypothetical protein PHH37_15235 [Paludibacter sp.]|nr:hypothetical protein [Paludibacter sp.]
MVFELKNVVPWGRNLAEYRAMFGLTDEDLQKQIAGFGDGPASFNAELTRQGGHVVSFDPLYLFDREQIRQRIMETKDIVELQTRGNQSNFVWKNIRDVDHLMQIRLDAMTCFLDDFDVDNSRYIPHEMPEKIHCADRTFDLGLSSHFLMLYPELGLEFHIRSIVEMLRICHEIRIFPLLNLNAVTSEMFLPVMEYFSKDYQVEVRKVNYEFQKNGNEVLVIQPKI